MKGGKSMLEAQISKMYGIGMKKGNGSQSMQ